jgi:hypothetical protein
MKIAKEGILVREATTHDFKMPIELLYGDLLF